MFALQNIFVLVLQLLDEHADKMLVINSLMLLYYQALFY